MNRQTIESRLARLAEMRQQQLERLRAARQDEQGALASLERIEGAVQDCDYWLEQTAEANGVTTAELAERN